MTDGCHVPHCTILWLGRAPDYRTADTEVAVIFYALFESAKLSGVDPRAYVLTAAKYAIRNPGAVILPQDLT